MTTFIRLLDVPIDEKPAALKAAVAGDGAIFECSPEAFAAVPGSPFAYWVSDRIRNSFTKHPPLQTDGRRAVFGGSTKDDQHYLSLWFEADKTDVGRTRELSQEHRWSLFAKGGSFSPYYADVHLVVNWFRDGAEVKADIAEYRGSRGWGHHWTAALNGHDDYFRSGLTWPRRTDGLSFRALPAGCIFADKGPAAFVAGDDPQDLLALSALLNSRAFGYLVGVQLARTELAQSYEVGLIQRTPVPNLSPDDRSTLAALARRAWSLRRALDTVTVTSHAFVLPPGLNERVTGLDPAAIAQALAGLQREIDDRAFVCYCLGPEDRAAILTAAMPTEHPDRDREAAGAAAEDADDDGEVGDPADLASGGLGAEHSWLIGVAFARFDPRLATGERPIPPEPEPFDPLPARSPGMVPEGEEPADRPDILVDDAGHPDDLTARAQAVAERVKVDVPENLRAWLAREFFPLHIRMYSKSRRKAPIYWQLATPSAGYSVWLYIHAFSKDTLFRVQNDYVAPKLAHEERRLEALTLDLRDGATPAQRKDLAEQQTLVEELRAFLAEVKRVAPLWNPNLDDGVIINFAPLWRLVPQRKSWQRELKSTWDALCGGQYDWAHLALHLWPERVAQVCHGPQPRHRPRAGSGVLGGGRGWQVAGEGPGFGVRGSGRRRGACARTHVGRRQRCPEQPAGGTGTRFQPRPRSSEAGADARAQRRRTQSATA